jgi:2,3-bisphosphoglycerate-dependent phosphoglycerate mutase
MRLFLVRHGESLGNVDPAVHARMADHAIPLSDGGAAQAEHAGRLLGAHFDDRFGAGHSRSGDQRRIRLWTSPYARTRQTADGLQRGAGGWLADRREHILLCEQQFGLFDGIPDEDLATRFPHEYAHYAKQEQFHGRFWARMPLGESRFDVATRVYQAFGTFLRDRDRHGIENAVIVCHGVTLRAIVMMWCHRSPEWFDAEPNPGNAAIRVIDDGEDRGYLFAGFPP